MCAEFMNILYLRTMIKISRSVVSEFLKNFNPRLVLHYLRYRNEIKVIISGCAPTKFDLYLYYDFMFRWKSPTYLKKHRQFFSKQQRGFGEKPFHSAWRDIILHYRPELALEIGVYRGQVISLWALISEKHGIQLDIYGISPLSSAGDAVSNYLDIDYEQDILGNFERFNLQPPHLLKAYSNDLAAQRLVESKDWDLIYIDGGHDFETVLNDYRLAYANLKKGGILCFDDSSLFLSIDIEGIFKGHIGPSKVVENLVVNEMTHLMTVGHNNFFIKN